MKEHKVVYGGIELSIKPYCHNCEKFKPVVLQSANHLNDYRTVLKRVVSCESMNHCINIENFIKENMKNEDC